MAYKPKSQRSVIRDPQKARLFDNLTNNKNIDDIQALASLNNELADDVSALQNGKQDVLISGTNIKTINGNTLLGSGDLTIGGGGATWGSITGILSTQTDLQLALNAKENTITAGTTSQYYRGDKTFQTLDKTAVGLGNVDNTSDLNKPISTATQAALDLITDVNWTGDYNNGVTYTVGDGVMYNGASFRMINFIGAAGYPPPAYPGNWIQVTDYVSPNDIGLGNIDNTSDLNKPISTLTQTALNAKQNTLTLTTTGTSGAATLVGATLNIPQYSGGGGASIIKLTAQTLTAASWVLSGGFYTYTFSNVNITTNTRVDFTPDNTSYLEVTTCGMQTQVTVASGSCTFFSLFPPQSNILGEVTIFPTI